MTYAKITSEGRLEQVANFNLTDIVIEKLTADGFLPYECEPKPSDYESRRDYQLYYRQEDGKIIGYYDRAPLDKLKANKISKIMAHDSSTAVNSFTIDGDEIWIPLDTRLGLVNQANSRNALYEMQGVAEEERIMTIRNPETGQPYTKTIMEVLMGMAMLEIYAGNCYNTTADHVAAVKLIETIEELDAYDYTTNYPEKINL